MRKSLLLVASATLLSTTAALAQGDECTGALAINNGPNGPFSNAGSTTSTPAWPCATGGNDVWFSYTATCTANVDIDTCGGTFDSALEVFDGTGGCGALVSLGCNDDACGLQSRVTFAAVTGTTYYIRMGGFSGATGSAPINVTCQVVLPNTLTTTFANNNGGGQGGGVYFDVSCLNPAGLTITSIDVNLNETVGTPGTIEVYTIPLTRSGNETNQAAWTLAATGTVTAAGAGTASAVTLNSPIPLPAGASIGVAYRAVGVSHAYTNGNGTNQNYSNADLSLAAGEASNVAFAAPLFTPRVVNTRLYYSIGASGTVASRTNYGTGCVAQYNSFYENFATSAALDLANSAMSMVYTGNGYSVLPGITSFVAPSATAQNLALTDDSQVAVNLSAAFPYPGGSSNTLNVCSNGFISVGGNGTGFAPAVATMLNNANIGWYCWHDYLPNATNNVMFEEVGGIAYITWNGVPDFGATGSSNTFQFQVDLATGNVHFVWQAMSGLGNGHLVGYSLGGASADPGNRDISATLPGTFAVAATDIQPLRVATSARPVANTAITIDTSNIPAGSPFGAVLFGFQQFNPGIDLTGLGMPGCFQHNEGLISLLFFPAGSSGSLPFNVPNAIGVQLQVQSAVFAPAAGLTPIGAISSNGISLLIGNL